jgi:hypothetical protein
VADVIILPQDGLLVRRTGLANRLTPLSGGTRRMMRHGRGLSGAGGTSDGWSTSTNFDDISGATSLSLFAVFQTTTTASGVVLARWGTSANFGGLNVTFDSGAVAAVIAQNSSTSTWYGLRTSAISADAPIRYGMTWPGHNAMSVYLDGLASSGSTWFSGTPLSIQSVGEKLYFNRHADSASGGDLSLVFAAIGINRSWSSGVQAKWAREYLTVFAPRPTWPTVPGSAAAANSPWYYYAQQHAQMGH